MPARLHKTETVRDQTTIEIQAVRPALEKITGVAHVLLIARRYDESIEQCRRALEMDPNLGFAYWLLGLAYTHKGSYEPAIQALQKSIPLSGDSPDEPASLGLAYALSGKKAEARKILDELKRQSNRKYIAPSTFAIVYGALGEKRPGLCVSRQGIPGARHGYDSPQSGADF